MAMDAGSAAMLMLAVFAFAGYSAWWWARREERDAQRPTAAVPPEVERAVARMNAAIAAFDGAESMPAKRRALAELERMFAANRHLLTDDMGAGALARRIPELYAEIAAEESRQRGAPPGMSAVDAERIARQKVAYGMIGAGVSAEDKAAFKRDMTEFAAADPLVRAIVERAVKVIEREPGILQSRIYPHFPDHTQENVRYALYFAHELGLLYRKKKGSSYQLFPAGRTIDGEAVR